MTTAPILHGFQEYIPLTGDITHKHAIAYRATRSVTQVLNTVQMAFAEAYMNGMEVPDGGLKLLFNTCMPVLFKYFPALLAPYEWVLQETEHLAEGSRELMDLQYDLPQEMLNQMLGDDPLIYPKYSMGLWENGAKNLRESQLQMIEDMITKMNIQDGEHILDIGCGWGCVANVLLSKFPNLRITGINLSRLQCNYIRQKMEDPRSHLNSERFNLIEGDFNDVSLPTKFDKALSVGVFCHIGNLTRSFEKVASFLKPEAVFFLHIITVRTPNSISSPFTHKYIFPHGRYWHFDEPPRHDRHLKTVDRWYMNGINYHKTFAAWLENFDAHQDTVKDLDYGMDYAKFRRMWRFYLLWLGTNFATCGGEYNGNGQFLMTHV